MIVDKNNRLLGNLRPRRMISVRSTSSMADDTIMLRTASELAAIVRRGEIAQAITWRNHSIRRHNPTVNAVIVTRIDEVCVMQQCSTQRPQWLIPRPTPRRADDDQRGIRLG